MDAKALAKICKKEMMEFLMEFIVLRFVIPRIIVTDNDTQFVGEKFTNTLSEYKIKHIKASVAYPKENGLVEVSKRKILQGLKKSINEIPRCWVHKLPNVLWAYRMTPKTSKGVSPFRMAYGVEAVSPVQISLTTARVDFFDPEGSYQGLGMCNDLAEEVRDEATARILLQQSKTSAYFNKKVKVKQFLVNDLVLRESTAS